SLECFFFQAEDGIRDFHVTGVQTCALPIFQQLQVPTAPIVLGLILGPLMEQNFMMSVIKTQGSLAMFFTRPISAVLALLCLAAWLYPLYRKRRQARAAAAA